MARRVLSSTPSAPLRGALSERVLRALLDDDRDATGIVAERGGKISRRHYALRLGCTPSALTRFSATFTEYEDKFGVTTGPLRRLTEMREWLQAAYEAGELDLRDGKIGRLEFQRHFNFRGGTFLTRYPPIRALFDELDLRGRREGYLPVKRRQELTRVAGALAEEPRLNKDRLTINRAALAQAANVSWIRLRDPPFAAAITAREAEIAAKAVASQIDPSLHDRVFPFSHLASSWSSAFLSRVGIRFKQVAAGLSKQGVKKPYLQLVHALQWIGASANPHCKAVIAAAAVEGRILSVDDWEEALFAYRAHLVDGIATEAVTDRAVNSAIGALRIMLNALASGGVVPVTSTPLPGIKYSRRRGGHLRSVAEAVPVLSKDQGADYVAFARDRFLDACHVSETDMGTGECEMFIESLVAELRSACDLPHDPIKAIRWVLERRLKALRDRAASTVVAAMKDYQRGGELLSTAVIDATGFEQQYLGMELHPRRRAELVRDLFPHPRESPPDWVERGKAKAS